MRMRIAILALAVAVLLVLAPTHPAEANYGGTHCVAPGQTLYSIAQMYGTSVWAIARANGISNPNYIRAYQCLRIPNGGAMPPYHPGWHPPYNPACGPGYHKVQFGQTLFSIGRMYTVSPWSIASANGLANPNYIRAGQCLYIPRW